MLERAGQGCYRLEHDQFRETVRRFIANEFTPRLEAFEANGKVSRDFWRKAGRMGLLCPSIPESYGGPELDFSFNAVLNEEFTYAMMSDCLTLQSDVTLPYMLHHATDEQKARYLPAMATGELVTAIAMTEPGAGSDLRGVRTTARRDGDAYVVNGSKTYITNGQNADLVVTVCKSEVGGTGISLLLIEADTPGFRRGRNLEKVGQWSADTSELFFDDVRVPAANLLGEEHCGFGYLVSELVQERLSIALTAQAAAQRAFDEAVRYTRERTAFGTPVIDFQSTRFTLADLEARLQVGWAHIDWALARHVAGRLTSTEAAKAKLWHTETQWQICDAALQLHGGAGYMNEYPIARIWRDARVRRIYGGSSEIMKEVIARPLGSARSGA